ncbi:hypothetical protein IE81DRAFT_320959 [Ceraceosorus guamensis]|uniref:CWH43-like N-terminal domain-containing protein n=1 Tax=Ceraceosorus guamensis TaxID=1522189 RepID=A0A316W416_9BASI|nr:hypothetical protein IE81DRAFT_320959 [Ceraceosorus guamensis]PWN44657.1 hypothetical protein IE81DRAFT_320959 [Ceraceosorus guamensis]
MLPIHGYYWLAPLITFAFWCTDIFGLLGLWGGRDNFEGYSNDQATVVFISDVGARHKTFFIIFSSLSAAFYILTTLIERHLRHQRRIPGSLRKRQTRYDIVSVVFAVIGAAALVLLSVFDAVNYSNVHWSMTVVFVAGVAISVLFQTLQIFSLSKSHDDELWHLRAMAIVKSILLAVALVVLIVFVVTYGICSGDAREGDTRCNRIVSVAGVAEWTCAFILALFFLTYTADFYPARKTAQKGLTEDGEYVADRNRAIFAGEGHKPEAPYAAARDLGPNATNEQYNDITGNSHLNGHTSDATLAAQREKEAEKAAQQA